MMFTKQKLLTSNIYTHSVQFPLSFTNKSLYFRVEIFEGSPLPISKLRVFSVNVWFINTVINSHWAILIFQ